VVSSSCRAIWRLHSAQRSVSLTAGFGAESLFCVLFGVTERCGRNVEMPRRKSFIYLMLFLFSVLCCTLFRAFYVTHRNCLRLNKRLVQIIEFIVKGRADSSLEREGVAELKYSDTSANE